MVDFAKLREENKRKAEEARKNHVAGKKNFIQTEHDAQNKPENVGGKTQTYKDRVEYLRENHLEEMNAWQDQFTASLMEWFEKQEVYAESKGYPTVLYKLSDKQKISLEKMEDELIRGIRNSR